MTGNDPRAGNGIVVSGQGAVSEMTIGGDLRARALRAIMPDGTRVTVLPDRTVTVTAPGDKTLGNSYHLVLPTVAELASRCDATEDGEGDGEVPIPAYHRHHH